MFICAQNLELDPPVPRNNAPVQSSLIIFRFILLFQKFRHSDVNELVIVDHLVCLEQPVSDSDIDDPDKRCKTQDDLKNLEPESFDPKYG